VFPKRMILKARDQGKFLGKLVRPFTIFDLLCNHSGKIRYKRFYIVPFYNFIGNTKCLAPNPD
jgi:hypothetical protein